MRVINLEVSSHINRYLVVSWLFGFKLPMPTLPNSIKASEFFSHLQRSGEPRVAEPVLDEGFPTEGQARWGSQGAKLAGWNLPSGRLRSFWGEAEEHNVPPRCSDCEPEG